MNLTMDNLKTSRETKHNSKREVYLLHSAVVSVENVLITRQNIRTLVIIGQRDIVCYLHAISELTHIQELWIVECGIKEVPFFKEKCQLKKLYLYSNEISCISNLQVCLCLTTLFLSGNHIQSLENLDKLTWLEELNLADNKLERINKSFFRKSEIRYLNLAGNHLCFLRDIKNLTQLQKLNSVVFADLLYGECPLVALCNYRAYVIHHLPHIKKLDHYYICEKERYWINQFFRKQIIYYNVLFHKHLNEYLKLLKHNYGKYEKVMLHFKSQLYAIKVTEKENCLKNKTDDESQNIMLKMELNKRQFNEEKQMAITLFKILQQQLIFNMNTCGNINFDEYNATPESTVIQLCKQFLEESLCSVIKHDLGITGLKLHKVTKVSNKEIDHLDIWKDEFIKNSQSDECSMILQILASPGVTDIQKWPFKFFKTDLFTKEMLMVTNCLAVADADWLNTVFLTKEDGSMLNLLNVRERRRVCVLIQTPIFSSTEKTENTNDYLHTKYSNNWNNTSKSCQKFMVLHTNIKNPMFVIEYEYILHKLVTEDECKKPIASYILNDTKCVCLSTSNIMQYIGINEKVEVYKLEKICISGQNISSIDIDVELPNLREFDISFNRFEEFPNSNFMKSVKILNINSNNIQLIHIQETLPMLEELDISWNCLTSCLTCIKTFATSIPNMYKLKICNNPFKDVTDPGFIEYVMHIYLPNLQFINNYACESLNSSQTYVPCVFNMCKLKQCNKVIYLKQTKNNKEIELIKKKNIESAKYIHVSQDFLVASIVLKKALKIQELCATRCSLITFPITKPLKHLIKLNLGSNLISVLNDFTQENFPLLKYLDLTNNLITSLESMGSFHTLQEFYCGNNEIRNLIEIDNIKTWQMLHVIDFSNNPIIADALYKKFIIFHLSNIQYISGECVQNSDIAEARYIFGNKLDKYMLSTIYKPDRLANITQLSIINCSLSKVDLPAELLPQLESLDLSKNQITYLGGLYSLQNLHTLCLSYNCLVTFDGSGFEKNDYTFPRLNTLFLDHNYVKSLMNISNKLPLIKHLFLNNNYLQNVNGINHCPTLESLILDYNEIELLIADDFIENNNLKILSFENNKIKSLEFTKPLQKLEKLYAANNCLANENEIKYISLLKNLEELTFEGNPLYTEMMKNEMIAQDFEVKHPEIEEI